MATGKVQFFRRLSTKEPPTGSPEGERGDFVGGFFTTNFTNAIKTIEKSEEYSTLNIQHTTPSPRGGMGKGLFITS
jgi:hypothetical protein